MEDVVNDVTQSLGVFTLKAGQLKVVMAFLEGRDVFVSLPTGYGKSLIYAILPAVFDKLKRPFPCLGPHLSSSIHSHIWREVLGGANGGLATTGLDLWELCSNKF